MLFISHIKDCIIEGTFIRKISPSPLCKIPKAFGTFAKGRFGGIF